MKKNISDISEHDFLIFVQKMYNAQFDTEEESIDAVLEFKALTEHPSGSDLVFYPEKPEKSGAEAVVAEVKAWRAANGKPGFKTS